MYGYDFDVFQNIDQNQQFHEKPFGGNKLFRNSRRDRHAGEYAGKFGLSDIEIDMRNFLVVDCQ